jgi:hypothetical protein
LSPAFLIPGWQRGCRTTLHRPEVTVQMVTGQGPAQVSFSRCNYDFIMSKKFPFSIISPVSGTEIQPQVHRGGVSILPRPPSLSLPPLAFSQVEEDSWSLHSPAAAGTSLLQVPFIQPTLLPTPPRSCPPAPQSQAQLSSRFTCEYFILYL